MPDVLAHDDSRHRFVTYCYLLVSLVGQASVQVCLCHLTGSLRGRQLVIIPSLADDLLYGFIILVPHFSKHDLFLHDISPFSFAHVRV